MRYYLKVKSSDDGLAKDNVFACSYLKIQLRSINVHEKVELISSHPDRIDLVNKRWLVAYGPLFF